MKWIYILVIGAVIVLLGYFIVTSMQSPSSSMSTNYNIGGNSYPSGTGPPTGWAHNPDWQNSIEIPVQTERPLAPMTATPVNTGTMQGVLYSTPSQPSGAVVVGTGQYAGDKWIVMGPGQGTHIEAL